MSARDPMCDICCRPKSRHIARDLQCPETTYFREMTPAPDVERAREADQLIRIAIWNALRARGVGDDTCYADIKTAMADPNMVKALTALDRPQTDGGEDDYVPDEVDGWLPVDHGPDYFKQPTPQTDGEAQTQPALQLAREALEKIELISTNHGGWFENGAWKWGQMMGDAAREALSALRAGGDA